MTTQNTCNVKLTLVEENNNICDAIGYAIREQGYQINTASTAVEALEIIPDSNIVLVDLVLKDLDGLSLIEEIKARFSGKSVVAMLTRPESASPLAEDSDTASMAKDSGADAIFIAPFNLGDLMTTIERLAESLVTDPA